MRQEKATKNSKAEYFKGGKIDFLIVLKEHRGKGYGKNLMDWAMGMFEENGINSVEVKVVDGNDVIHLYEQYGFRINAHILKFCFNGTIPPPKNLLLYPGGNHKWWYNGIYCKYDSTGGRR